MAEEGLAGLVQTTGVADAGEEVESYARELVGHQNDDAMRQSMGALKAADESRWCPRLLTVGLTEAQLGEEQAVS